MSKQEINVGDVWVRRPDRGTPPVRVEVVGVERRWRDGPVSWRVIDPKPGQRRRGQCARSTWLAKYDREGPAGE